MNAMTETKPMFEDRLDKLEAQCTDLFRQLRGAREAIRAQETVIAGMAAKIEERTTADDRVLSNHNERLMNLQDRICALENYTGIDVRSAPKPNGNGKGREQAHREGGRTIKGGWVNVYRNRTDTLSGCIVSIYDTREQADIAHPSVFGLRRIACIQIPDITEGEGL